ncbi:restriction endonuclease subunit S [Aeromonas veronii]
MSSEAPVVKTTRVGGRAATEGVIRGRFALSVGMPKEQPPEGWEWVPLSSVARLESGHTPSRKHPEYWGGKIPWIGIRDATSNHGRTIYRTEQTTNSLGIENSSARVLPANTVCLSRTASVGYVVVMGVPMATSQDFINWVCSEAIDYSYLKYVLFAEHDSMLRFASGTTHQTIYFPEAKAFHVCLPPIAVQRRIVDSLQTLDDRIALLRETNATLEAIAQALFKSWFVDFDPVHANAGGEQPAGLPPEVAALFPDSFEESDLGQVPKGWSTGSLNDLALLNPESWTVKNRPDSVAYVDLANAKENEIAEITEFLFEDAPSRARRVLRDGDTIVGTVRPGNRSYAFISNPRPNLTGSTGFAVLRPKQKAATEYVYLAATANSSIEYLAHVADGGAYPAVRPEVVSNLPCVLPSYDVLNAFHAVAAPLFAKVAANHQQAQTLATLRDTLLPRLISGQLRLPDAEEQLSEAGLCQ